MPEQTKQVAVSDAFRLFADFLDDPHLLPLRIGYDPDNSTLAAFCDALGVYARHCGTDLRSLSYGFVKGRLVVKQTPGRRFTDELRRFADMLERNTDRVRRHDPNWKRLGSALKAINHYANRCGVDLGLGLDKRFAVHDKDQVGAEKEGGR